MTAAPSLDLSDDVVTLTAALCDIPSVSRDEAAIAEAIEVALRPLTHLTVTRHGNTVVARTELGRAERVVLAGHIDTVPLTDPPNLPTRRRSGDDGGQGHDRRPGHDGGPDELVGRGTVDMKGGVAVQLRLAAQLTAPNRDVTYVFYEGEEIDGQFNGLAHLADDNPHLIAADFAVLLEPTDGAIEGGCKGTLRADVVARGVAAHSARPWNGANAIHAAGAIVNRLIAYEAQTVHVEGLDYHEALQAVGITGGIAGNVIPDRCVVTVNYRYAPDKDAEQAAVHVKDIFTGFEVDVKDNAPGARPGLTFPAAQAFVEALGVPVRPKEGWTDVARFSALGVPAVNYGPGDPNRAHTDDERAPIQQYLDAEQALLRWLR